MATQPDLLTPEFEVKSPEVLPAEQPKQLTVIPGLHPLALVDKALEKGVTADTIEKLMQLAMQWDANEARKAFVVALNAFKANPPVIDKNKHVSYENRDGSCTEYDHATLDHVVEIVSPALSQQGLSHRWKTTQAEGKVRVTCILTHALGHSEETTLESGPDTSGGKNAVQGIGSAVTYLQRYTLLAAIGLAAQDQDDDGQAASEPKMDDLDERIENLTSCRSLDELRRVANGSIESAKQIGALAAVRQLTAAAGVAAFQLCHTSADLKREFNAAVDACRDLRYDDGIQKLGAAKNKRYREIVK